MLEDALKIPSKRSLTLAVVSGIGPKEDVFNALKDGCLTQEEFAFLFLTNAPLPTAEANAPAAMLDTTSRTENVSLPPSKKYLMLDVLNGIGLNSAA